MTPILLLLLAFQSPAPATQANPPASIESLGKSVNYLLAQIAKLAYACGQADTALYLADILPKEADPDAVEGLKKNRKMMNCEIIYKLGGIKP